MKNLRQTLLLVSAIMFISASQSCTSFIGAKLLSLHTGSTVAEVLKADDDIVDPTPLRISAPDLESKSSYGVLVSEIKSAAKNNRWVYVFKNGELLYWGYPYQFTRHADAEIRTAGEAMVNLLVEKDFLDKEKD
ncbi:MAG: hypothetical protein ACKOBV_04980 [Candidatus Kapaibacterium sp.]